MKFISQMKGPGATVAGILSLALGSVVLLCGAGSLPVENFTPQGPMQTDLNAGGHNMTNVATVSATNVVVSGTLTAANLGSAATNAASAFAAAAGPFPWADVTGAPSIQGPITLTTSGTSGAATFSSGTLNIPQYAGGVTSFDSRTGVVTLQASDLAISGASLTALPSSPSLYPTLNQNTTGTATYALNVPWSGVSGAPSIQGPITLTTSGTSGAATFSSGTLNIPQYAGGVTSFNTRTGAVTLAASDVNTLSGLTPNGLTITTTTGTLTIGSGDMLGSTGSVTLAGTGTLNIGSAQSGTLTGVATSTVGSNLYDLNGVLGDGGDVINLPHFLAQLAKVRAGSATNVRILLVGDSTMVGYGATSNTNYGGDKALSPSYLLANMLTACGIPAYDAGWLGTGSYNGGSTLTAYDPRVTTGSGWTQYTDYSSIGGGFMESSSTSTLTFSPGFLYDHIEVYYVINPSNGSFTVNNGGSSLGTTNTAGTAAAGKVTYTVSLTSNPVSIVPTSSTVTFIAGVVCYNSTQPGILIVNGSEGGGTISDFATSGSWNTEPFLTQFAPNLTILNLLINDSRGASNATSPASAYQTSLQNFITFLQGMGSDVFMTTPVPPGDTSYLSGATTYLPAYKAAAANESVPLLDISTLMPGYSTQNSLSLRFDTLHPNAAGYQYYSSLVAQALWRIISPTMATQVTQTIVNGSTAGSAVFSEPSAGSNYKKVLIELGSSLSGTASYTFPTAFVNTPVVVNSDAAVTSLSSTAVTVTGTLTLPRTVILEGY